MPSTFFGLNIASSGLNAFQIAINTTANNISNLKTEGYTRQNASLASSEALRVNARYGSTGSGVNVVSIRQERDLYYDTKYWSNNSSKGYYEQKLYYLEQIEDTFADDANQKGFATIFASMFNSLDTLISNGASEGTARNQFLNNAQSLCTYFNSLATQLEGIQDDCNEEIKSITDEINAVSEKISLLNLEINQIETGTGAEASELRDERAKLVDELSELVDVETEELEVINSSGQDNLGGTNFRVIINGQLLVENGEYRTLKCEARKYKENLSDIGGLYDIVWSDTGNDFAANTTKAGGKLKALIAIRDGDNSDNLTGTAKVGADKQSITIENPSITDLKALNITDYSGTVTVKNRSFVYESWDADLDEDGNIKSITFNLEEPLSNAMATKIEGGDLSTGSEIDSMGVPYYMAQINQFVRTFAELFNDIEESGQDLYGNQAEGLFEGLSSSGDPYNVHEWKVDENDNTVSSKEGSYYRVTAKNICANNDMLKDPNLFSTTVDITNGVDAYDIVTKLKSLQSDVIMFRGNNANSFLETLISDVSVDTEKSSIYSKNYENLEKTISNQRTSVSGVDEDEEALQLVKFQNAYNLASKVISVMAELYDKLINETGV